MWSCACQFVTKGMCLFGENSCLSSYGRRVVKWPMCALSGVLCWAPDRPFGEWVGAHCDSQAAFVVGPHMKPLNI